jgi:hypothetical protein
VARVVGRFSTRITKGRPASAERPIIREERLAVGPALQDLGVSEIGQLGEGQEVVGIEAV